LPSFPATPQAWSRCGDPVGGLVVVMVAANDLSVFDGSALKITQANAFVYYATFELGDDDLIKLHAGAEISPPLYDIPEANGESGYTPTLPETVGALEDAMNDVSNGVVELAAGAYTCSDVTIPNGVVVRPEAGEHVVINLTGRLYLPDGGELWDVDILNADIEARYLGSQDGIQCQGNSRIIGCTISNLLNNGVSWFGGGSTNGGTVAECLIFNNGFVDTAWKGHGHDLYTHNGGGGQRYCLRNILLPGLGDKLFQAYSGGSAKIQNYLVQDSLFAVAPGVDGCIVGGSSGVKRGIVWDRNMQYNGGLLLGRYAKVGTCEDVTITNNIFGDKTGVEIVEFETVIESGNTAYGNGGNRDYPMIEDPVTIKIVPCTLSQRKIAHIGIMHPENTQATEAVLGHHLDSLQLANGDYELVNAHNPDESHPFEYDGSDVTLPLTGWTAQRPIAWAGVWNTLTHPEFSAWILREAA
jgi:hypothetical protein